MCGSCTAVRQVAHSVVCLALLVLALGVGAQLANAVVIYDNGAIPDQSNVSDPRANVFIAADFSLSPGANTVTDVHWTGVYIPDTFPPTSDVIPATDDFTIQIYAAASGNPSLAPLHTFHVGNAVQRTDTGMDIIGILDLFSYSVDISPTTLTPGEVYWLSIFNLTVDDFVWAWALQQQVPGKSFATRGNPAVDWQLVEGYAMDFQLTGPSVPEPATLALVSIALAGLGFARRRKAH